MISPAERRRGANPPWYAKAWPVALEFLTLRTECSERDVIERAGREHQLTEQSEHERHHRCGVGGKEVAPTDLLERGAHVDVRLRGTPARRALEDVEGVAIDGGRLKHAASPAPVGQDLPLDLVGPAVDREPTG